MPHGFFRSLVMIFPSYGVDVFTPAIRVCPGKAGLYVEFGGRVSTGAVLSLPEDEFVFAVLSFLVLLSQAENKMAIQTATKENFFVMM